MLSIRGGEKVYTFVVSLFLILAPASVFAKANTPLLLRQQAEKEIQVPTEKLSKSDQRLATVDVPLPALKKEKPIGGSVSLLFSTYQPRGLSRYVDEDSFDLSQLPASPGLNLLVEKEFSFLPVATWFSLEYSSQTKQQVSPIGDLDTMRINTLALDVGPGYRLRLFENTFLNFHVGYGRFWLMQSSPTGLANESTSLSYISTQVQFEVMSLWGSPWRPIIGFQKRWGLGDESIQVTDPRFLIGLMYREGQ